MIYVYSYGVAAPSAGCFSSTEVVGVGSVSKVSTKYCDYIDVPLGEVESPS